MKIYLDSFPFQRHHTEFFTKFCSSSCHSFFVLPAISSCYVWECRDELSWPSLFSFRSQHTVFFYFHHLLYIWTEKSTIEFIFSLDTMNMPPLFFSNYDLLNTMVIRSSCSISYLLDASKQLVVTTDFSSSLLSKQRWTLIQATIIILK